MKLKTVIVEDEKLGQEVLVSILADYCNESIEIVDLASTVEDAIVSIRKFQPQLIFLDITLGTHTEGAFEVLKAFGKPDFNVIFTTSSKQSDQIIKALNTYGAKKYLLKPLDIDEVVDSVKFVIEEYNHKTSDFHLSGLMKTIQSIQKTNPNSKLQVPARDGMHFIPVNQIIMLRADKNSTMLFLTDGNNIRSSRNLSQFEEVCLKFGFIRTSRSFIINPEHVERYNNVNGGTVYLSCKCSASVSDKYSKTFFEYFDTHN